MRVLEGGTRSVPLKLVFFPELFDLVDWDALLSDGLIIGLFVIVEAFFLVVPVDEPDGFELELPDAFELFFFDEEEEYSLVMVANYF
jgi:hypothetical protein